jgi:hypothetical protein
MTVEIAMKIMRGEKLTEGEFQTAKDESYFLNNVPYEAYVVTLYEDDKRLGQLCTNIHQKDESFCSFGIHADQVNPNFLTEEQVKLFTDKGWTKEQLGSGDAYQTPRRLKHE